MFKKLKIRVRLIILISLLIVLTMSIISTVVFRYSKNALEERLEKQLYTINNNKKNKITSYIDAVKSKTSLIENHINVKSKLLNIANIDSDNDSLRLIAEQSQRLLEPELYLMAKDFGFNRIMLKSLDGNSLVDNKSFKSFDEHDFFLYRKSSLFNDARKGIVFSEIYHPQNNHNDYYITLLKPNIINDNVSSIWAFEISMENIYSIINDTTGLGDIGETILTRRTGPNVGYVSKPIDFTGEFLKKIYSLELKTKEFNSIQRSVADKNIANKFSYEITDHNGEKVDMAWSYIPSLNWGILTKMNHEDSYSSIQGLKALIISLCVGILFFVVIIITIFVDRFLTPIINIRDNMVMLAQGMFPKKLNYRMNDEIQDTTVALNNLTTRLKNSTNFAQQLGIGDLNVEYENEKNKDVLSVALVNMRESLLHLDGENNKRKWASEGLTIHAELLRKHSDNLHDLGKKFISSLVNYIDGVHGAIYSISHVGSSTGLISLDEDNTYYELIGTFAYDLKEDNPRKIFNGKGLVGQAARERKTIIVNDVPQEYLMISSGLGKSSVTHVLCVPMIINTQVMGVVELTNFKPFEQHIISFVETLGESFASAVMSVKLSEQTQDTLKEFEETTSELLEKEAQLQSRYDESLNEIKRLKSTIGMLENNLKSKLE